MSGIAGIIHFDGRPVEPGQVERMTAAMPYRGPDGINHWVRGNVALGQCMMRTTPESLEEVQPLTNEDESLVLVMDGRVDNWEELRRELLGKGAVLRTRADAELVLRAYQTWGADCLAHIDGDFALVIWDARQRTAFCARDRLGNKPFNYHWDGKTLVFASELHTILAQSWVPETLNDGMVAEFLANEWHSRDETFWVGVNRLVAAHQMRVDARGPALAQYWEPDLFEKLPCVTEDDYADHYRALFTDVVRRQSRAAHPVAIEVSGGLDSSAIFAVAEHLRRDGRLLAPRIDGYTLDFHDDEAANELRYARAVGDHLGTTIHEITPTRMPLDWYRDLAQRYREFPSFPNGAMVLGIRQAAQQRGSRVLLGGIGGDEWLCGRRTYYAEALAGRQWRRLLGYVKSDGRDVGLATSLRWVLRHGCYPLLPGKLRSLARMVTVDLKSFERDRFDWLPPDLKALVLERRAAYKESARASFAKVGQRELLLTMQGAFGPIARELEERTAAYEGIESRRPFYTTSMVQFAFSTSPRLRLQGSSNKHLHRRALAGLLPDTVLARQDKADFGVTFLWHSEDLAALCNQPNRAQGFKWGASTKIADMYDQREQEQGSSARFWLLWSLFGCAALS